MLRPLALRSLFAAAVFAVLLTSAALSADDKKTDNPATKHLYY